ncbi:MAG: UbiA prenyltransferase family protein [Bauldia sp.]|nr:UbiA prenyltransferase family protein [Bauldia sp.]
MNAPLVIGIIILAVGAWLLIARVFHINLGRDWWPLIFLVPGLAFLALAFSGRRANPGLAVAGAIVATLGGIFLFQSATHHWESWAYIWALFPLAAGVALMAAGNRNGDEAMQQSGMETARWAGIAFVALLVFFELFIYSGLFGFLIPIALVLVGGYMIWQQINRSQEDHSPGPFGTAPGPTATPPPPVPPAPPPPPAPDRSRPWESGTPSVIVPPPPAPAPRAAPPEVIVTPPPPAAPPPAPPPVLDLAAEPFPADELPPDPSVPVPTAPFPVDEGSEQIAASTRKRTRTPRPKTPKAP